ncbi:hypothetical protein PDENDC454_04289 [Paenibacillus dendritiformis C454]|uniref:Uncharacterized protein n=1 Tax=Paenibacillus dendritiformis C454 TaxID=1131935 RepID=H3SBH2_9BACL|nr:hypothetical protein [Paenibacillus dendritiformis]EHQ63655.1 hypothetical protein PDENDC454_04289 [Paenibacillus dendritiformis C454]
MKAKVTIAVTRIIDLDQEEYVGMTDEERLQQEIFWAKEYGYEWMEWDGSQWQTTGELIEDGEGTES